MNKEYAIYPFRYMNITQRHDQGTHIANWSPPANYSDLPWDEAIQDGGRSYFEPQNDFVIEEILGVGNNITNTVRLKSINKLYLPYKDEPDFLYLTLSHMNEDNLRQLYVGQILGKDSKILLEGTDGFATGNHFHITANLGKYYGFLQNSNGAWCFTYQQSLLPDEAFYFDKEYTKIINSANYNFKNKPINIEVVGSPVIKNTNQEQIEVISEDIYCYKEPGLNNEIIGYVNKGIYNYVQTLDIDGKTWYDIGVGWVLYNQESFILYPKDENINDDTQKSFLSKFVDWIIKTIKKIFKLDNKKML